MSETFSIDALDFFNALSGQLRIELTEPAQPIGGLLDLAASSSAEVVSVTLEAEVFEEDRGEPRPLTKAELDMIVFYQPRLGLKGESGDVVWHEAPDGNGFKVRDLLRAVEETERQTRGDAEWLGGVDVHHTYFEGIHGGTDGVWEIYWGS